MAYARDWELQYYQRGTKTVKKGDPEQDGQLLRQLGFQKGTLRVHSLDPLWLMYWHPATPDLVAHTHLYTICWDTGKCLLSYSEISAFFIYHTLCYNWHKPVELNDNDHPDCVCVAAPNKAGYISRAISAIFLSSQIQPKCSLPRPTNLLRQPSQRPPATQSPPTAAGDLWRSPPHLSPKVSTDLAISTRRIRNTCFCAISIRELHCFPHNDPSHVRDTATAWHATLCYALPPG